jgi:hypothetical protein
MDPVALFAAAQSTAQKLAIFEEVILHEPKAAPQSLPMLALWLGPLTPLPAGSGLSATAVRVSLRGRIYTTDLAKPEDAIDARLLTLASTLLGAYSGGYTFGGQVELIDLLGIYGETLSGQPGFIDHDGKFFRVFELNLPLIIDALWSQVP